MGPNLTPDPDQENTKPDGSDSENDGLFHITVNNIPGHIQHTIDEQRAVQHCQNPARNRPLRIFIDDVDILCFRLPYDLGLARTSRLNFLIKIVKRFFILRFCDKGGDDPDNGSNQHHYRKFVSIVPAGRPVNKIDDD